MLMQGSRWEEEDRPGLRKARMDARMVLETDKLLHAGLGPKIVSPFDVSRSRHI